MYFTITTWQNFHEVKEQLLSFPDIEEVNEPNINLFNLPLKDLRKLKIKSLQDEQLKEDLSKLQHLLNDETQIKLYGEEKPKFNWESMGSTGSSGIDGTSVENYIKEQNIFADMINEILN